MGPIIPAPVRQFMPPLLETNPNVRKGDSTEKRKRATPKKKLRPATSRATVMHPPLPQALPKPTDGASSVPVTVREDTPQCSTGKMSGNLFEERNWVLPKDYLVTEDKKEDATMTKPPLEEESKMGELTSNQKEEKCGWGPDCPFCKAQRKDGEDQQQKPLHKPQAKRPNTLSMTKTIQQWEEEMERLNTKYNLDCFSNSELDSKSQMKVNSTNMNMVMKC